MSVGEAATVEHLLACRMGKRNQPTKRSEAGHLCGEKT
jgi:hypothetical protein